MANEKPLYKTIDMNKAMRDADGGKATLYSTYRFSNGRQEIYADKVGGGKPKFVGRR